MVRGEELARRLVVRRGSGGNCTYSAKAKRELVELCQSGVASVAKVAQTYDVNPNQLHNWMRLHRKERLIASAASHREVLENQSLFIPVVQAVMLWADPQPLPSELLPVLPFNLAMLPSSIRPWIADIAERMKCPVDFLAVAAMVGKGPTSTVWN